MLDYKDFLPLFLSAIPPLDDVARKGTAGRIGIVGGSKNYTGAPFFASKASLIVGGDLAYVVCCKSAAPIIKSYSPELIVLPILDEEAFKNEFTALLPKLHSVIVGPGLGRKKEQFAAAAEIIKMAKQYEIPITIDADAVLLVAESPELVKGYTKAILTPNAREFDYLCEKMSIGSCNTKVVDLNEIRTKVNKLSSILDGATVLRKGKIDFISNGIMQAECSVEGSGRRCGGQGDILAGAIGTFSYWSHTNEQKSFKGNASVIAAYAGCCLVRKSNSLAFKKFGRSMLTTNILESVGQAYQDLGFK